MGRVQVPFPDVSQAVAVVFQDIGPTALTRPQLHTIGRGLAVAVANDVVRMGVLARHQHSAIGATDRVVGDRVGQRQALFRKAVQVGREDRFLAQKAQRRPTHLVRKHKNQIRLFRCHMDAFF